MPCSENLHDVCKKTTKQNAGSHTRIATGRTKKKSDSLTTVAFLFFNRLPYLFVCGILSITVKKEFADEDYQEI